MSATLVFVPTSTGTARRLVGGEVLRELQAFAVTPDLLETVGLASADDEDAERACLQLASVWGLARHGTRLVLVAEVPPSAISPERNEEAHNGGVWLSSLGLRQVQAFFADDPRSHAPQRVATLVQGMDVDGAWELDALQALLREADLLWHAVEELPLVGQDV